MKPQLPLKKKNRRLPPASNEQTCLKVYSQRIKSSRLRRLFKLFVSKEGMAPNEAAARGAEMRAAGFTRQENNTPPAVSTPIDQLSAIRQQKLEYKKSLEVKARRPAGQKKKKKTKAEKANQQNKTHRRHENL